MNLPKTLGLATVSLVWLTTTASAQRVTTNPTAVPNTVSTPTFQPDTLRPSREQMLNDNTAGQDDADRKNRRERRRNMRRNNRSDVNSRQNRQGSTTPEGATGNSGRQDATYRESSTSNGTVNNNSNTTNYNSNQVTTAPTGVGSNPSATGAAGDVRPGTVSAGSAGAGRSTTTEKATAGDPNLNRPAATGTGTAVSKAENAPIVNTTASVGRTSVGDFIAAQPDYTTLQNAFQSAQIDKNLREGQSYTVFAPSNAAFKKLPAKIQNVLLEGQNRDALSTLLSYHVVPGVLDVAALTRQIGAGNGSAQLKTLSGATLTAKLGSDGKVVLTDEQGHTSRIDTPNQVQTNGVVHGIDTVLMPKESSVMFR
ncbi:fasciclin domain-containing protein [Rudanella paleaurantiibacter]|uniref:Fasciclin domain-containing protein n=1 Tax=Rudanella paleaurantiibacter TaxID=2614655 RepID=A0A7J5U0P7_9BACT|nr:fasciclin domain-containing protein [Rudanella paleaurantiibacter]KAB7731111.1 fasciclin domain-containing protein [Rudanella paleaurantiibacter]